MPILTLANFLDQLVILEMSLALSESVEIKSTAGGQLVIAEHGVRLWHGSIAVGTLRHDAFEETMARIRRAQRPGMSFEFSPVHFDGRGRSIGSGSLYSVDSGRHIRIAGLNPGELAIAGTFISMFYGGAARLHQLAQGGTVNGSGILGPVEIVPDLEDGWVLDQFVTVARPYCHAVIVPGSVAEVPIRGRASRGIAFRWRQQLL